LPMESLFLALILSTAIASDLSVFTTTYSDNIPFVYSTLGSRESEAINFTAITYLYTHNFSECSLIGKESVDGHLVIFPNNSFSTDLFQECVADNFANVLLMASVLQNAGALGLLITPNIYEVSYHHGQITGFSDKIDIPVLVIGFDDMKYLLEISSTIIYLVLPPISAEVNHTLCTLYRTFYSFVIVDSILYGVCTVLLSYLVISDIYKRVLQKRYLFFKKRKGFYPIVLKLAALVSSLCLFLHVAIDPFSYKLNIWCRSQSIFKFGLGLCIVVYTMILKIWASAAKTKKSNPGMTKFILYLIYAIASVQVVVTITNAVSTNMHSTEIMLYYSIASITLSNIGYVYYGRELITTLCKGQNANLRQSLPIRIALFISCFIVSTALATGFYSSSVFGEVINTLLVEFFVAFMILFTFLVLFFHKLEKTKKHHKIELK